MRPRTWIVSSIYFDVESYLLLRDQLLGVLSTTRIGANGPVRFVAIDDSGGLDPDIDRLRSLADVRILEPPFNLGHQRAFVFGLRSLAHEIEDTDFVVTLDADGEDQPSDLPRLLAPLLEDASGLRTVALAVRTKRRESLSFKVLYFFFRILFRSLTGIVVRSGNYAAYRGWLVRRIIGHPHFDLCYSSAFLSLNLAIHPVPAERGSRLAGVSRMGYSRLLMHGVGMLLPFTDRIAIRALLGFSLLLALSGGVLLAAVVVPLFSKAVFPTWILSVAFIANILSFIAIGNLVILFAAFSLSRGTSLMNLERGRHEQPRIPSRPAD